MAATAAQELTLGKARFLAIPLAVALAAILAVVLIPPERTPTISSAFPAGEIIVGVDASFPPFALDDGETIAGLDIDLAHALAAELNLPVRIRNIGFYALHDALLSGQVDILVSALRIDPARMDDLRYAGSYFDNGLVLVTAAEDPVSDIKSLANSRIAYEYASSAEGQVRAWEEEGQSIARRPYELPEYALDALQLGLADAAIVDATTLRLYLGARHDWTARYEYITHEPYAIAVRIDRVDAWKLVDGAVSALQENGELARILDKWL
ncbi:MAG: ABC transporter substrate-binding protein [Chloroflexi bacterium]|nr:ABC transporter substrate-binding protein [Chloroflexota bacterium]